MRFHTPALSKLSVCASGKGVQVSTHIPAVVRVSVSQANSVPHAVLGTLKPQAQAIHGVLLKLARDVLAARGQSPYASQVVFHMSGELLALHLGIGRATLYRHLPQLKQTGLIAYRGHVSDVGGKARKDGTLFAVSLREGYKALLRREDYRHSWRDLGADIASGMRTAWKVLQEVRQSQNREGSELEYHRLLAWAVNPGNTETPVKHDCLKDSSTSLEGYVYSLDVLSETHKSKRSEAVDMYARALARGYGDSSNLNFWRWLLWRAIEGEHRGEAMLYQLQNALTRLKVDVVEWEGLKRPGALLVARLRQAGIWDSLNQVTT